MKSLASIGERSPTECGVPSVSGEQEEVALSFYERVRKTNGGVIIWLPAGHGDAAESDKRTWSG